MSHQTLDKIVLSSFTVLSALFGYGIGDTIAMLYNVEPFYAYLIMAVAFIAIDFIFVTVYLRMAKN